MSADLRPIIVPVRQHTPAHRTHPALRRPAPRRIVGTPAPPQPARPVLTRRSMYMLVGIAALIPLLLIAVVPQPHVAAVLVAYVNLVIIGAASWYFGRQYSLPALIAPLFLAWLAAGYPLASIHFAIASPNLQYITVAGLRDFLSGNLWLQFVTLLFIVCYLGVLIPLWPRTPTWNSPSSTARLDRRAGTCAFAALAIVITLHAIGRVRPLPGFLQYLVDGGYLYLHGFALVLGVFFHRLAFPTRLAVPVFLGAAAAFYSIGNARGKAFLPIALFVIGLIFFSDVQRRWKKWFLIGAIVAFPVALAISNTTRVVTRTIGFQDLDSRLDAMSEWRQVLAETPVLSTMFGRLFFVAGHTIVTMSPEPYPYLPFSARRYLEEFAVRLFPRRYTFELYYSEEPNRVLQDYGFMINDYTSVPMSIIGSLYMLGGVVPLALGAVAIGLFHCGLARCLGASQRRARYFALLLFSMLASEFLFGQNRDPLSHLRNVLWSSVAAIVLYVVVVRPFLEARPRASAPVTFRRRVVPGAT